ncbi:HAD family hydrolase [Amycolatopsis nigrescens]|uniref:HAD family hydrolase n=1 Tax=Amycolatopsis nigrescens TaxID=381445 RepID=UPI000380AD0C|nr:HAD family phosphatase [Amycolatopsis nigrescens]
MHDAALFDLDGTLVNTEPRSQAAWSRLFSAHQVPCDDRLLKSFAGRPGKQVLAEQRHLFGEVHTIEELFAEAMSYATLPAEPVPGAVEMLRQLHERGVPVGVVTSGTRDYAVGELDTIGVLPLLSLLITAEDVRNGKPDPEGYLAGCRTLGSAPERTVVFEDAPAGVSAAKAAGTFCVAVTTTQPAAALAAADLVVDGFAAVRWPIFAGRPE